MFVNQEKFYFATIRKIAVSFGSIFKDITVQRFDQPGGKGNVTQIIKVPLGYAESEKWYAHAQQGINAQQQVQRKFTTPRIAYRMTGMQYNAERKLNSISSTRKQNPKDLTTFLSQLNPVPYDFSFEVYIAIKNKDDGLQIIEQILPNFCPSYTLNIKDIPELNIGKDIPVIFQGVEFEDEFEGAFDIPRVQMITMTFVVKGYIYPVITDAGVIKKVIANFYDGNTQTKDSIVTVNVDPISANVNDVWSTDVNIYEDNEIDSNGNPIVTT